MLSILGWGYVCGGILNVVHIVIWIEGMKLLLCFITLKKKCGYVGGRIYQIVDEVGCFGVGRVLVAFGLYRWIDCENYTCGNG